MDFNRNRKQRTSKTPPIIESEKLPKSCLNSEIIIGHFVSQRLFRKDAKGAWHQCCCCLVRSHALASLKAVRRSGISQILYAKRSVSKYMHGTSVVVGGARRRYRWTLRRFADCLCVFHVILIAFDIRLYVLR